jgi:hypothetical protein
MNVELSALWLPILLSTVAVFIVSSLIWAVIQYHNSDWKRLPDEESGRTALKGASPGQYAMPYAADNAAKADEAWQVKYREGPVAMITVVPHGELAMGKQLVQWFAWCLLLSIFVGYIAGTTLPAGSEYLKVFQITSTTAILAYGGGAGMNLIWFGATGSKTVKDLLDALVYGLVTGGIFGSLWP